jgi:hypothetical protein
MARRTTSKTSWSATSSASIRLVRRCRTWTKSELKKKLHMSLKSSSLTPRRSTPKISAPMKPASLKSSDSSAPRQCTLTSSRMHFCRLRLSVTPELDPILLANRQVRMFFLRRKQTPLPSTNADRRSSKTLLAMPLRPRMANLDPIPCKNRRLSTTGAYLRTYRLSQVLTLI